MPAGTIAVTNGSATVTGAGTSFSTELKVNDFVAVTVGGVVETLGVQAIASNTSLTLVKAFTGPSASGLSWTPIPAGTLVGITAQIAAQVSYAIRGLNLDKVNWQQILTGTGNVTVNLSDGSSFTGPAWGGIATSLGSKLDKSQNLQDVTDKAAARSNIGLGNDAAGRSNLGLGNDATGRSNLGLGNNDTGRANLGLGNNDTGRANLGLGNSATRDVGTVAGTVAAGNDTRITTLNGNAGGILEGAVTLRKSVANEVGAASHVLGLDISTGTSRGNANLYMSINGAATRAFKIDVYSDSQGGKAFSFFQDSGSATCSGQWINGSDERHKSNIKLVPNALAAVLGWRGATYDKKDGAPEVGLIAQDVEKDCPEAILMEGEREFSDGTIISDFKYLNTSGAAAAYHTEAIKALFSLVEFAIADPDKALEFIDSIKGSVRK